MPCGRWKCSSLESDGVTREARQKHGRLHALRQLFDGLKVAVFRGEDDRSSGEKATGNHLREGRRGSGKKGSAISCTSVIAPLAPAAESSVSPKGG
jgi:hypothetical protein